MREQTDEIAARRPCPFLAIRESTIGSAASGSSGPIICEAGGGVVLHGKGKGREATLFCPACDIPRALAHPRACLYLVPFRIFRGDQAKSYYACRWRLDFKPLFFPEDIEWCRACRHWFPRPPEELVHQQIEFSRLALKLFSSPNSPYIHPALEGLYSTTPQDKKHWHQSLREKVRGFLKRRKPA